jgi:uncharacterized C2H2 Zn-finger protein
LKWVGKRAEPDKKKLFLQKMNFVTNFQAYPMALNVEIKQESNVAPNIFNCSHCNQTFRTKKELKEHKQNQHTQIKNEPKERKSRNETGIQRFSSNYVPHQPKFQCEYCFKGFDQSHRLKQHQISHRDPIFQCDQVRKIPTSQCLQLFILIIYRF